MKQFQIVVLVDEVEWGKASYIQFSRALNGQGTIRLEGFTLLQELPIQQGSGFLIKISCKGFNMTDLELIPLQVEIKQDSQTILLHTPYGPDCYYYKQDLIDLLAQWNQGMFWDWRKLKVKQKRLYLVGCLYWSGLPQKIEEGKTYLLDGSQIKRREDLYCLLGEVFFGERGYFGQDLDGLHDCICCEIKLTDRTKITTVTITDATKVDQKLSRGFEKYESGPSYLQAMKNIFEEKGCYKVHLC